MDADKENYDNQTIKTVPPIQESLTKMGINLDLDENTRLWLTQLKTTWITYKRTPAIENDIEAFFQSQSDPYRLALGLIMNCYGCKDCKPKTLAYLIVEILQKWSKPRGILPENHLKLPALHIALQQKNASFICLIINTYQIVSVKDKVLPLVKDIVKTDNCLRASQIIIAMRLFEDIPVESLLFPLVLQGKNNFIDEYLSQCPNQAKPFLLFIDKLLDPTINIDEFVQNYIIENEISDIKYDKLQPKTLRKLVTRLCKKFNVPPTKCNNYSTRHAFRGLNYLIYQKYHVNSVSNSVWEDLVKELLKQNACSGQELIDMLIDHDRNEAIKWASYLNIPENDLPLALRRTSLNNAPNETNWDGNKTPTHEYYKFSLSEDEICIIDTVGKFNDIMMPDIVNTNIVSIDCEWPPSIIAIQRHVALLQLAIPNKVYLIDPLILNKADCSSCWSLFNKSFLDNTKIIKIGFGLENDIKVMKDSIAEFANIKVQGKGLLDLHLLWKSLVCNGLVVPGDNGNRGHNLSAMVQSCFGLPLDKSEQCSNWELRPLRNTQIVYAALDAHVLLLLYDFLLNLCLEQSINFEEICNDVMMGITNICVNKPKSPDMIQTNLTTRIMETRSSKNVKLMVDNELSGILPYLRYCGMDAIVFPVRMLWLDVISLAILENRLVLVSKSQQKKHTPTVSYPQTSILELSKNIFHKQVRKVLNSFNVTVDQESLFSICINCNSSSLSKLSVDKVIEICKKYIDVFTNSGNSVNCNSYNEDGVICEDNYELSQSEMCIKQPQKTKIGIPIVIDNPHKLLTANKPAILCDACGKLFWSEDRLFKPVSEAICDITGKKFTLW